MKYLKNIKTSWVISFIIVAVLMGGLTIYSRLIFNTSTSTTSSNSSKTASEESKLGSNNLPVVYTEASWRTFSSLEALADNSGTIIIGRAIKSEPGRLVPDAASSVGLPFMNTRIEVEDILKGNVSEGEQIIVEQTGGEYIPTHRLEELQQPIQPLPLEAGETEEAFLERQQQYEEERKNAPSKVWLEMRDNPLFVANERVFLFLNWEPSLGVYQISSIQGRFYIDENDQLVPMLQENPVSQVFAGKSQGVLKDAINSILGQE